ncbi:MAG: adenylate/guanylate cyclase domain-containing protein, partial [Thermosynechococcaceae cyanobacterium]
ASALVLGFRQVGGLQFLELAAYDRLVQTQPDLGVDPRLVVVGITERDIQKLGQFPIPDAALVKLLQKLQSYQPRVIGLDMWRGDIQIQPGTNRNAEADRIALVEQLKSSDRIITIAYVGDEREEPIAPPPGLPIEQIGFNDLAVDPGGVLRRNLLYISDYLPAGDFFPSFSLRTALRYLRDDGIEDEASDADENILQIGKTAFLPLTPRFGGYVNLFEAQTYQIMLRYRSVRNSVKQVSLTQVLENQIDAKQFKDRVVLIGTTGTSGRDYVSTPYSSGLNDQDTMPGVVAHAQMVSQFLDAASGERSLIYSWSDPVEMLWILSWAFCGGVLAWLVRRPLGLVIGGGAAISSLLLLCQGLFLQSVWVPLVPSFLTFLGASGGVVSYRAQQSQRQQKMVMRLLGQSSSPEIAETLWQRRNELLEDGKLPGQALTATLMFTDLKGFSSISEQLSPNQLLNWLNEYFEVMTDVVVAHSGVINKFTGDGLMAVFGVPIPREDRDAIAADAQQAVTCALKMGTKLNELNERWQARGLPEVQMRVGVFTGSVVVGSLGSKARLEYGVIGDSVNTASRLESVDKDRQPSPCRVLIAKETLDYLSDNYEVEAWGALSLKGKAEQVEVYRVIDFVKSEDT